MSVETIVDEPDDFDVEYGPEWAQVLWVDPGPEYGWAVMGVHPQALSDPEIMILDNIIFWHKGQVLGSVPEQARSLTELCGAWDNTVWGCEAYQLPPGATQDKAAQHTFLVWGAMECIAAQNGRRLWVQNSSQAKTECTTDRMRRWGFYLPGNPHATDATKHCISFLRRAKQNKQLRAEAWPELYS